MQPFTAGGQNLIEIFRRVLPPISVRRKRRVSVRADKPNPTAAPAPDQLNHRSSSFQHPFVRLGANQDFSISAKDDFVSSATEATFRMMFHFFS